jgi:hypothetical protein
LPEVAEQDLTVLLLETELAAELAEQGLAVLLAVAMVPVVDVTKELLEQDLQVTVAALNGETLVVPTTDKHSPLQMAVKADLQLNALQNLKVVLVAEDQDTETVTLVDQVAAGTVVVEHLLLQEAVEAEHLLS